MTELSLSLISTIISPCMIPRITFHYATDLLDDLLEVPREMQEYKDYSDEDEDEDDEYVGEDDVDGVQSRTKRSCK